MLDAVNFGRRTPRPLTRCFGSGFYWDYTVPVLTYPDDQYALNFAVIPRPVLNTDTTLASTPVYSYTVY